MLLIAFSELHESFQQIIKPKVDLGHPKLVVVGIRGEAVLEIMPLNFASWLTLGRYENQGSPLYPVLGMPTIFIANFIPFS